MMRGRVYGVVGVDFRIYQLQLLAARPIDLRTLDVISAT